MRQTYDRNKIGNKMEVYQTNIKLQIELETIIKQLENKLKDKKSNDLQRRIKRT